MTRPEIAAKIADLARSDERLREDVRRIVGCMCDTLESLRSESGLEAFTEAEFEELRSGLRQLQELQTEYRNIVRSRRALTH